MMVTLIGLVATTTYYQNQNNMWTTQLLRVEFDDEQSSALVLYSGCYFVDENKGSYKKVCNRGIYHSYHNNTEAAHFGGFCQHQKQYWYFYKGNYTNVCKISNKDVLTMSERTFDHDVSLMFDEKWMSISRTPLTLYFSEDNYLHEEDCGAFLGDRICNNVFNTIAYLYDEGDFCGPTCTGPTCGLGNMKIAFNTTAINNDGYSTCLDE